MPECGARDGGEGALGIGKTPTERHHVDEFEVTFVLQPHDRSSPRECGVQEQVLTGLVGKRTDGHTATPPVRILSVRVYRSAGDELEGQKGRARGAELVLATQMKMHLCSQSIDIAAHRSRARTLGNAI